MKGNIEVEEPKSNFKKICSDVIDKFDPMTIGIYCKLVRMGSKWKLAMSNFPSVLGVSKDRVKKAIQQLEREGFLQRVAVKDDNGKFEGYKYRVLSEPAEEEMRTQAGCKRGMPNSGYPEIGVPQNPTTPKSGYPENELPIIIDTNNKETIKNNRYKSKDKSLHVADATTPARRIDYDAILHYWNEQMEINGANIPKIREMSNDRKRWIRARLAECKNGIEDIKLVIQKAAVSDFMNRRCGGSWLADFDWIFEKKRNFEKVLGKRYDNEENVKPLNTPNHGTSRRDIEEMQRRDEAAALMARLIAENE